MGAAAGRASIGCAGALVVFVCALSAAADDTPLTLTWVASEQCPSGAEVVADVQRRLGGSVSGKPVQARAQVSRRKDATWQVVLTTTQEGAKGRRTLEAPTCAAVASATALILALTIDPQAAARTAAEGPTPTAPPTAPPTPPPTPTPTPTATPTPTPTSTSTPAPTSTSTSWDLLARAAPVLGIGVAANLASAGLSVAVGAGTGPLSLELTLSSFLPASHDAPGRPGMGGSFWPLAVGTSLCEALFDGATVRAGGCAGIELQRLQADGYGVSRPGSGSAAWTAPTGAAFLDLKLTRALWLASRLDAAVPLRQPTFLLGNVGPVFRVSPVSARISAGIEARF